MLAIEVHEQLFLFINFQILSLILYLFDQRIINIHLHTFVYQIKSIPVDSVFNFSEYVPEVGLISFRKTAEIFMAC